MNNFFKKIKSDETGQSLIEILIALTIGAILIGAASTAVVTVLQSGTTSQRQQTSTVLAQDYIEKVRSFASSDWHNLYNLQKTSSTVYQFQASSSETVAVEGVEGVIDNDIRGGLAGYWSLDEASSTVVHDKSGTGNNGIINGATATSTDNCRVGRCYYFDNDSINISNDSTIDFGNSDDFTMTAWTRKEEDPSDGNVVGIFGKRSSNDRFGIDYYFEGDDIRAGIRNDTDGQQSFGVTPENSLLNWNHITFVYESEQPEGMKLYLNGNLVATSSNVGFSDFSSNADLEIGSDFGLGGTIRNFIGYIDDVRIYDRVLMGSDIEHLYNSAVFERYFYVENVCRTSDADYELAGVHPCDPGETDDPSTQKVTVVVNWGDTGEFIVDDYITRWRNRTFPQTDWSGGSGSEGPFTEPTNEYSTSTDIATSTPGSIKVEGI